MIVTRMFAGGAAKDGGVFGTMVGGSTTGSFPDKAVTLQNRLPAGSCSMDIKDVIREFMANDCIKAQDITVNELANHVLVFGHQNKAGQEVAQEEADSPHWLSYRLAVEPAWENEEEAGLALRLWVLRHDPYELQDISDQASEQLVFDQTVAVKFGQSSLVGFPSSTSRSRRSVYWLLLSVEAGGAR